MDLNSEVTRLCERENGVLMTLPVVLVLMCGLASLNLLTWLAVNQYYIASLTILDRVSHTFLWISYQLLRILNRLYDPLCFLIYELCLLVDNLARLIR